MKFSLLFKKEIKEMLSVQTFVTMICTVVVLIFAGQAITNALSDTAEESTNITLCDLDKTDFTAAVLKAVEASTEGEVKYVDFKSDDYPSELDRLDIKNAVIIPKGFTEQVKAHKAADITTVSRMTSLSTMSNLSMGSTTATALIEAAVKSTIYADKIADKTMTAEEMAQLEAPININETTVVADKQDNVSSQILAQLSSSQGMVVPIIMFVLIIYSSQMILNAISTEKLDKTLETLLSAPVSRMSVLSAKMLAAGVVAALQAVVYMFGMNQMMSGITGSMDTSSYNDSLEKLGLSLSFSQYAMIGVQMFLSILIALSVSMILGALAKDAKSAQTLLMPITFSAMIPYMMSMFIDLKTASPVLRYIVYAIPFTHTFMAGENAMFGNYTLYFGGICYQVIFLAVCLMLALKLFMSDRIFTMTIGGKPKKKKSGFAALLGKK